MDKQDFSRSQAITKVIARWNWRMEKKTALPEGRRLRQGGQTKFQLRRRLVRPEIDNRRRSKKRRKKNSAKEALVQQFEQESETAIIHLVGNLEARRRKNKRERWKRRGGIGSSTTPLESNCSSRSKSELPLGPLLDEQGTSEKEWSFGISIFEFWTVPCIVTGFFF